MALFVNKSKEEKLIYLFCFCQGVCWINWRSCIWYLETVFCTFKSILPVDDTSLCMQGILWGESFLYIKLEFKSLYFKVTSEILNFEQYLKFVEKLCVLIKWLEHLDIFCHTKIIGHYNIIFAWQNFYSTLNSCKLTLVNIKAHMSTKYLWRMTKMQIISKSRFNLHYASFIFLLII